MPSRRDFLKDGWALAGAAGLGLAGCGGGGFTPAHNGQAGGGTAATPDATSAKPGAETHGPTTDLAPPPDLFDAGVLDADFWLRPRTLTLHRPATGEDVSVLYWKDGTMLDSAYERICHILRDVQAQRTVPMDPKLIETLWACQAFCARYGMTRPMQVLSGYRTAETNRHLIEAGLPAARKSLHMDGKAADIRILQLNTDVLGGLVRSFERGGVGFYYRQTAGGGWIHTDTGVNRIWHG